MCGKEKNTGGKLWISMLQGNPFMQAIVLIALLVLMAAGVLYCWDIWMIHRYCIYRYCSCKKRAEKVILPEALITHSPITIECREFVPQVVRIC